MTHFSSSGLSTTQVFANARIVQRERIVHGMLTVDAGVIGAIDPPSTPAGIAVDCDGDYLLPGLVEIHTDHLESQLMPRLGAEWPPRASVLAHDAQLVAAGITTVLDALSLGDLENKHPRHETLLACIAALDAVRVAGMLRADHWLHLRCELAHADLPALLEALADHPRVRLLSLMDHTPGQRQFRDVEQYRRYYARSGVVWSDEEFAETILARQTQQRRLVEAHRKQVIVIARQHALRVASHDDASAADIDGAVADGVSIAEFPVSTDAARAARRAGLSIVAGAPNVVRGGSHTGNVAASELARNDWLDILSSDFVPASLLHAAFVLSAGGWSLPRAVATVTETPARLLGFDDRGAIEPGMRADLVRVRVIDGQPVVIATWCGGERRF